MLHDLVDDLLHNLKTVQLSACTVGLQMLAGCEVPVFRHCFLIKMIRAQDWKIPVCTSPGTSPRKTCLPRKPEIVSERKHPPQRAPLLDGSLMSTSYPWQDQIGWRNVPISCGAQMHSSYSHDRNVGSINILTPPTPPSIY